MGRTAAAALAVTMACAWGAGGQFLAAQAGLTISVLSSRPDMVSGGDALVEVKTPTTDGRQ